MNIIVLGLPGSGKGTQTRILSEKLGLPFVGTGDLLRKEVREKTPLGEQLKPILDRGDMPPDELVVEIFLNEVIPLSGFVADGFPRSLRQQELLEDALKKAGKAIDYILYLDLSKEAALNRLLKRLACLSCGATYGPQDRHKKTCDFCGDGVLGVREDDQEGIIQKRLHEQNQKAVKLLAHYQNNPSFYRINADQSLEKVSQDILDLVKKKCH